MPAEAIHLSALDDTLVALPLRLRATLVAPATWPVAKLGAMFVDLPYYEGITGTLLRHTLGLPPRPSSWGDVLHQRAPIALGVRLGELGVALQRQRALHKQGDALVALALGYISHAAVDTALHPLVNDERASGHFRGVLNECADVGVADIQRILGVHGRSDRKHEGGE